MVDIFVYGEVVIDNIIRVAHLPSPQRTADILSETYSLGGIGANVAVQLASWGIDVGLSGNVLGDDSYGQQVRKWLGKYPALDMNHLVVEPATHTPYCRIMITPDGKRSLLFGSRDRIMYPCNREMLSGAKILALDLYGGEVCDDVAKMAREMGLKTVVSDIAWSDHPVLPLTDVLTNSASIIRREFPGKDLIKHAQELHSVSNGVIITTDGPSPVHVVDQDGSQFWVTPPDLRTVDTTGAGDTFKAGVIYSLLKGWDMQMAIKWGVTVGSLNTTRVGAVNQPPTLDEIEPIVQTVKVKR
jgi:ribokinase